jgi:PIN domain nuclease of toxin-antitoxin system
LNLLLAPPVLLWWFVSAAGDALTETNNIIYVSAAVAWELATKTTSGRSGRQAILSDLHGLLLQRGFRRLAVSIGHALRAGQLPVYHKDPFDRMLVAQAQALNFPILSADTVFDRYGVRRMV